MGAILNASDIKGMDADTADELINSLEAHLSLHYPCVLTLDVMVRERTLKPLLIPIIRRWEEAGTGLTTTEATGPFTERRSGGGGRVLWEQEKADIRKLCGEPVGPARPRGSFPPHESVSDLFVRRPGWPSAR